LQIALVTVFVGSTLAFSRRAQAKS
jgi:hypothetical protein